MSTMKPPNPSPGARIESRSSRQSPHDAAVPPLPIGASPAEPALAAGHGWNPLEVWQTRVRDARRNRAHAASG